MAEPPGCDGEKLRVRRDIHDRLGNKEDDDLGVGNGPPGVICPEGRKLSAEQDTYKQQVEVSVHRGSFESAVLVGTADFDLSAYVPFDLTRGSMAVELLI